MLKKIQESIHLLYGAILDKRSPWLLKLIIILLAAYILSPIDLIPDFIPVIGFLDEAVLIPLVLRFAIGLIPEELKKEYEQNQPQLEEKKQLRFVGGFLVITIWITLACFMIWLVLDLLNL